MSVKHAIKKKLSNNKIFAEYLTKKLYKKIFNRNLNLNNPILLTEKIQWLKLYDYPKNELVIQAADKYTLKEYLNNKKLSKYATDYLFVISNPTEIFIKELPGKFVMKKTNSSGLNLIVKDKDLITETFLRNKATEWLKIDFGTVTMEKHYTAAKDRIMFEPYFILGNEYRIFCIGGKPRFFQIVVWDWENDTKESSSLNETIEGHAHHTRIHLSLDWEVTWIEDEKMNRNVPEPLFKDEMIKVASSIAVDFELIRVDFQVIDDKLKIGELTLTPGSGFIDYLDSELDLELGSLINISKIQKKRS